MLTSRPRPMSAAFDQADAACPAEVAAAARSPARELRPGCGRGRRRRRVPHRPMSDDDVGRRRARGDGGRVARDRVELGGGLVGRGGEPVGALERGLERVRGASARPRRRRRDRRPLGQDGLGFGQERVGVVEPPGAHRVADRLAAAASRRPIATTAS